MSVQLDFHDAWCLANHKKENSNMARCYIALLAERDRLAAEVAGLRKSLEFTRRMVADVTETSEGLRRDARRWRQISRTHWEYIKEWCDGNETLAEWVDAHIAVIDAAMKEPTK